MTYLSTATEYGRVVKTVNLPLFINDLAEAFGGRILPNKSDFPSDRQTNGSIAVGELEVSISSVWNDKSKVSLSIRELNHKWLAGNEPYGPEYRMPEIRVSVDRPMKTLVKDITKRLLEPAKAPIAKRAEHIARVEKSKNSLQEWARYFRALGFTVRCDENATHNGTLYRNRDGEPYLSGDFYSDGRANFRSVSFTGEQLNKVLNALDMKP
jgi:hypothetical protein